MKTRFRIKQLWNNLFSISLIAFHIHLVICRPSVTHVDDSSSNRNAEVDSTQSARRQQQVRYYDLRNVGPSEIRFAMRGGDERRLLKNNDTLILYASDKDFDVIGFVVDDDDGDVTEVDDDAVRAPWPLDVTDVSDFEEGDNPRHHRSRQVVASSSADRNLIRKRRQPQPEPHRPHRRHKRRKHHNQQQHRLVLKARGDKNHLTSSAGDGGELKDRRGRYLIKSDSPGYVITSANEVKKDWCRTIPLRQKVSEPNCRSRVVQNNFCYGQCNSFFIPHTGRTDNKVAFQSCAFCKPFRQRWGNVTLNCPGRNPPKVEKTVLFVETCRCITEVFQ